MKRVIVKETNDRGFGVYAGEGIHANDYILDIDDSHIVKSEEDLPPGERDHIDYVLGKMIHMQAPEVYINHSCEPNVYIKSVDGTRKLFAMKDISSGEEVAYDYAINGDYDWGEVCKCGSEKCRGLLDNNFWHLPKEKQLEYLPYLDNWFRTKYLDKVKNLEKSGQ